MRSLGTVTSIEGEWAQVRLDNNVACCGSGGGGGCACSKADPVFLRVKTAGQPVQPGDLVEIGSQDGLWQGLLAVFVLPAAGLAVGLWLGGQLSGGQSSWQALGAVAGFLGVLALNLLRPRAETKAAPQVLRIVPNYALKPLAL